ncbi:hypothetical protein P280DRAFT_254661 [Massarina eburnea CBS 473.64]|uniref:Uncharacterized protein n=1 Tax=Massarina eburnea CBS 473.64 TaxID=1395130 RepID=A0A6A6S6K0_9PLEO|nr:hypothetical protein P280DRAFT_254661 [Massarina eburnea CBS 473.64]
MTVEVVDREVACACNDQTEAAGEGEGGRGKDGQTKHQTGRARQVYNSEEGSFVVCSRIHVSMPWRLAAIKRHKTAPPCTLPSDPSRYGPALSITCRTHVSPDLSHCRICFITIRSGPREKKRVAGCLGPRISLRLHFTLALGHGLTRTGTTRPSRSPEHMFLLQAAILDASVAIKIALGLSRMHVGKQFTFHHVERCT